MSWQRCYRRLQQSLEWICRPHACCWKAIGLYALVVGSLGFNVAPSWCAESEAIQFNRDVRPILSDKCFACHGQDSGKREADLRLDTVEGQRVSQAVVPGSLSDSRIVERIRSDDPDLVMPPPSSQKQLSSAQKELIEQWIMQGAAFEKHWSLVPPRFTEPPDVLQSGIEPSHPIDAFVRATLARVGLEPSPEADRETLIRRVSLDLTGLPPTIDEVDRFLKDRSPDAYERVVDRLLASPHFGERMALPWLDAARYADTHGYQKDNHRSMWLWRDWVIHAFNQNMPFDQFTVEQLAGDLLPNASDDQRIATGFHRNHRINAEAGSIDEEFLAEYAADRVETTSTVWLGLTVGCARCHDHKFDPITQRDYYQLYAFFNNIDEKGVDGVGPSPDPNLVLKDSRLDAELDTVIKQIETLRRNQDQRVAALLPSQLAWEQRIKTAFEQQKSSWLWIVPQPAELSSDNKMKFKILSDRSVLVFGENPLNDVHTVRLPIESGWTQSIRLEAIAHPSHSDGKLARSFDGSFVLSGFEVELIEPDRPARKLRLRSAQANSSRVDWPIEACLDHNPDTGWSVDPSLSAKEHRAYFVLEQGVQGTPGNYLNVRLRYESKEEQSMIGRFRLTLNASEEPDLDSDDTFPSSLIDAIQTEATDRKVDEQTQIVNEFARSSIEVDLAEIRRQIEQAELEHSELLERSTMSVMVMKELDTPRETFIHLRGAYDKPGERVVASTPASLTPHDPKESMNRLDLARWLVAQDNPLTARVAVNRFWQMYFGTGLVKTTEDFGTQGEWPSHPELLDWLALEFMRSHWDIKALQRLIVTSGTYRQSSKSNPHVLEVDPENRWLSRGPRFRLPAHLLRDQALAASGLLNPSIGGPSVKPYQPNGLWESVAGINSNTTRYRQDHGPSLYRRSLYTYWKRAVPPPSMMVFDAADREVCSVKRRTTNTPLQALTMLNDPTYTEAARVLASQSMVDIRNHHDDTESLHWIFQKILSRFPDDTELQLLQTSIDSYREHFRESASAAKELIAVGESSTDPSIDSLELAARTVLVTMLFNLDESLTKE